MSKHNQCMTALVTALHERAILDVEQYVKIGNVLIGPTEMQQRSVKVIADMYCKYWTAEYLKRARKDHATTEGTNSL